METSTAPAEDRAAKINQLMELIKDDKIDYYGEDAADDYISDYLKLNREQLGKYPTQLLNDLHQEIMHGDATVSEDLLTLLGGGNYSIADVHEHFVFRPRLNPDTGFGYIRSILGGLHHYPQLPTMENYAEAPTEVQAQIVALLIVTDSMSEHPILDRSFKVPLTDVLGTTLLSGDDLIQLVLNRTADAERIGRIIVDRKTTDAAFITTILGGAPALSHGVI